MWLIIILVTIVLLVAIARAAISPDYKMEAFLGSIFFGFFCSLFVFIAICVPVDIATKPKFESVGYVELVQLSDGSATDGRFGLFSGFLEEQQYYFYYYDNGEGIVNGRVRSNRTVVVEDSESGGRLEIFKDQVSSKFFIVTIEDPKYILHVPKGTVIRSWKLDGPN